MAAARDSVRQASQRALGGSWAGKKWLREIGGHFFLPAAKSNWNSSRLARMVLKSEHGRLEQVFELSGRRLADP